MLWWCAPPLRSSATTAPAPAAAAASHIHHGSPGPSCRAQAAGRHTALVLLWVPQLPMQAASLHNLPRAGSDLAHAESALDPGLTPRAADLAARRCRSPRTPMTRPSSSAPPSTRCGGPTMRSSCCASPTVRFPAKPATSCPGILLPASAEACFTLEATGTDWSAQPTHPSVSVGCLLQATTTGWASSGSRSF